MKYEPSLPQKNRSFVETRKYYNLSVPEFAILLGISTNEVVLFECGKKLVYDWVYEKLNSITREAKNHGLELPGNHLKETSHIKSKYDTNNPLLAIFKEVHAIQTKLNTETPVSSKKKKPRRRRRTRRNPNQLSLMLAIKEANFPIERQTENVQAGSYDTHSVGAREVPKDNKAYLLRRVHTELNRFNKHFNHYILHYQTLTSPYPSYPTIFFKLKQIRDNFIRELFSLQKQITTEDLPFIDILSAIDIISSQYTDKMILMIKEHFNVNNEQSFGAQMLSAE